MNPDRTPADGADPGTLHRVPEGLLDSGTRLAPPTAEIPFVPPYADHVEAAPDATAAAAAFAFADASAEPVAPPGASAPGAVSAPPTLSAGRPASSTMADRARRWGAPIALVAVGLVGGVAATGVLTNASASTPAGPSVVSGDGAPGSRDAGPSLGDDGDDAGLTVDQLDGSPDGDGDRDGRSRPGETQGSGSRSVSDGFTLAPGTQGTTGASG